MWRPSKPDRLLFVTTQGPNGFPFITHSDVGFKPYFGIVPRHWPWGKAGTVGLPVPVPVIRRAPGPATHRASAVRRAPASAAALPVADCPADLPAAAPKVARA